MSKTKIEWADRVWNPVTGCTKVSHGCKNCYAETYAKRFWGERKFTDVRIHKKFDDPGRWKIPQRIFVNSMSDLFHELVPKLFIYHVFAAMAQYSQHTFLVLTKRPARMLEFCNELHYIKKGDLSHLDHPSFSWGPLGKPSFAPNIWLGVSVENQATADERIPLLLQTPAAVRWISAEPLLGEIELSRWMGFEMIEEQSVVPGEWSFIDWVVCGGESGHGARPMHPDWARSLRDQSHAADTPFFFKQWGEWGPNDARKRQPLGRIKKSLQVERMEMLKCGKNGFRRELDGIEYNEFPKHKGEQQNG